jgi:hypothetical protein
MSARSLVEEVESEEGEDEGEDEGDGRAEEGMGISAEWVVESWTLPCS